jgi:hypothetical protein
VEATHRKDMVQRYKISGITAVPMCNLMYVLSFIFLSNIYNVSFNASAGTESYFLCSGFQLMTTAQKSQLWIISWSVITAT